MESYYFVVDVPQYGGVSAEAFTQLESANRHAKEAWQRLTAAERVGHRIYVCFTNIDEHGECDMMNAFTNADMFSSGRDGDAMIGSHRGTVYGYARVSTAKQATKGGSIADQVGKLKAAGAETIITECCTGTRMERPEFARLLSKLQAGDTLMVTKLDRFARSAIDGSATVRDLVSRGVTVNILNMGIADNTPIGKLTVTMMLAFAEFERDMIVERTQAGRAAKNARLDAEGLPHDDHRPDRYTSYQIAHAMQLLDEGQSYTDVAKVTGISKSTLIRHRRKERTAGRE